uniref:Uncharacterized protein n=1 Tax=Zea mays TaxID=4577 RepID=B6TQQ0_MAIZE|nr:hypothetical protein [Zea mays]
MARSSKMMVAAALLALALAVSTAEARNIKTTTTEKKDDAVVQPQTFLFVVRGLVL